MVWTLPLWEMAVSPPPQKKKPLLLLRSGLSTQPCAGVCVGGGGGIQKKFSYLESACNLLWTDCRQSPPENPNQCQPAHVLSPDGQAPEFAKVSVVPEFMSGPVEFLFPQVTSLLAVSAPGWSL